MDTTVQLVRLLRPIAQSGLTARSDLPITYSVKSEHMDLLS